MSKRIISGVGKCKNKLPEEENTVLYIAACPSAPVLGGEEDKMW